MPFTFSHPAIVLPAKLLPRKLYSMTGLIIGSMTPDFEYFIRMNVRSIYSHTFWGVFYFDLPLSIILTFIFHNIVRNELINNLPTSLQKRFSDLKTFNWNAAFIKSWFIVIFSVLIGAASHILWDDFTHVGGYFVMRSSFLKCKVLLLGFHIPVYNLLQNLSSLFGIIVVSLFVRNISEKKNENYKSKSNYWTFVILIVAVIMVLRFLNGLTFSKYGNIIVSVISAFLISVIIIPLFGNIKSRKTIIVLFLIFSSSINSGKSQIKADSDSWQEIKPNDHLKSTERFEFSFRSANPKAQKLMKEEFFWNPNEESGPFGSDDGADAAYGYYQWRTSNKNSDPIIYLRELFARWNYPYFDLDELDSNKIKVYITKDAIMDDSAVLHMKETLKNLPNGAAKELSDSQINEAIKMSMRGMGRNYLLGFDNAIIGTGFAQLALEGYIPQDLKAITIIAIKRELLPLLINKYEVNNQIIRENQLSKMLLAINSSN
jgi:uncharacterized protein YfeS